MKTSFRVAVSLTIWCLGWVPGTMGQSLPFTHYTTENELNALPSAEVHEVYQDAEGFIWMAIFSSGLVRYDGHRMLTYNVADGLRDVAVWDVLEDPVGRLWVASNGGLSVSEKPLGAYATGERVRFTTTLHGVPLLDVAVNYNRMALDADGKLWVGTDGSGGIVRYDVSAADTLAADTLRTPGVGSEEGDIPVRALVARRDGSVWASLLGGTLLRFAPGSRVGVVVPLPEGPSTNALYESPQGTLWGGRQNGEVWRLQESGTSMSVVTVDRSLTANVSHILKLRSGEVWVASENTGILELDPAGRAAPRHLTRANGLLSDNVYNLSQDREGNVWIAQSGGVSKLRSTFAAFQSITSEPREGGPPLLPSPSVNAVLLGRGADTPCALWAGTSEGGISCVRGAESAYVDRTHGLWSNWANGLAYDARGRLWIGTARGINGLAFGGEPMPPGYTQQSTVTLLGERARLVGYPSVSILAVTTGTLPEAPGAPDSVEVVLFPAYHALYILSGDTWITLGAEVGIPQAILHAAAFDGAGYLWVGTRDRGLYRSTRPLTLRALLPGAETGPVFAPVWSADTGAPSNQIETLKWHRGLLWIGTPEGLVALDADAVAPVATLTKEEGLPASNATSVAVSPVTGHLWVGTNGGLAEIDPATRTVLRTVTKQDGLLDNEVWFYGSVIVGPDGVVYYGTARGVVIYYPARDVPNPLPPRLHLTAFEQTENEAGRSEVAFEYAGLSFSSERRVQYRTRLLGYDRDWSAPTLDTRLRYTNLSAFFVPKRYTLQVLASNGDGVWTPSPLEYTFYVKPRWWLRWWAFGLYALLLAASVFAIDRVQRRRLINRERIRAREREQTLRLETAEAWANYLNADNERKTAELESSRQLQLSLLPAHLPEHSAVDIHAYMCTATEVGGDYYDWHLGDDGVLTIAIGDATGHGAAAGTVVTATKGLFLLLAGQSNLAEIMHKATKALKQMRFRKMFMALALVRVRDHEVEFVGGGMPPALLYRARTRLVEKIPLKGMPLGGFAGYPYSATSVAIEPGDVLLLMTDGFSELFNAEREMLGDERMVALFATVAEQAPEVIIRRLMAQAIAWVDGQELQDELPTRELGNEDDITFVVLKVREPVPALN